MGGGVHADLLYMSDYYGRYICTKPLSLLYLSKQSKMYQHAYTMLLVSGSYVIVTKSHVHFDKK